MGGYKSYFIGAGLAACLAPAAFVSAAAQDLTEPAIVIVPDQPAIVSPQTDQANAEQAVPEPYLAAERRLPAGVIEQWLGNPGILLVANPRGGREMIEYVALLAGSDQRAAPALIDLALSAATNPAQRRAIAFGLASAATESSATAPEYGAWISRLVASSGFDPVMNAYVAALRFNDRDVETAEIPGGGAAPGSDPGSLTGPGGIGPMGSIGVVSTVETQSGDFTINRRPDSFIDRGLNTFGGVTINNSDPSSAGS